MDDIFDSDGNLLPGINIISGPHNDCSDCGSKYLITGTSNDGFGHPNVDGTYVYYGEYISPYGCIDPGDGDKTLIFSNGTHYMFSDATVWHDCTDWIISDVQPSSLIRNQRNEIEEQPSIFYWAIDGGLFADDGLWFLGASGGYFDFNDFDIRKI